MSTKTICLSKEEQFALKEKFKDAKVCKTPPYAQFQLKVEGCTITAYTSGKVVFQGNDADFYADGYTCVTKSKKKKEHPAPTQAEIYPQCGSDEVGTGDYFGPVTVCATCVTQEDCDFLRELEIQDSKAITDERIRELGPQLTKRLTYSLLVLNNEKYNAIHPNYNMVAIKSRLHNQAFVHLQRKLQGLPKFCIIDQFVQAKSYYRYLNNVNDVVYDIHFETKAENKYLSVAAGSIIARYAFLLAFDKMCEQYDFDFPKGAGSKVDQAITLFVKRYGEEELHKVAKLHFANTKKALHKTME